MAPSKNGTFQNSPTTARERGTLRETLPKSPRVILSLVFLTSTALAAFLCHHSAVSAFSSSTDLIGVTLTSAVAAFGSMSAMAGVVYGDSVIHSFGFAVAALASTMLSGLWEEEGLSEAAMSSLKISSAPLVVALFASSRRVSFIFNIIPLGLLVNRWTICTACAIPFCSILLGSTHASMPYYVAAPTITAVLSLVVLGLYNGNRSHKNGALTVEPGLRRVAAATALAMLACVQIASATSKSSVMIPLLLGSLMTVLLSAIFASVADVWYAVGTGQFYMVSIDTAGILFYLITPMVVLLLRFIDRYGEGVHGLWTSATQYCFGGVDPGDFGYESVHFVTSGLLLLLGAVTCVGIPLVNAYCPLGGYLFGRAYMHGQPNTRRIALCVRFADLFHAKSSVAQREELWQSLRGDKSGNRTGAMLNIFVTVEDLNLFPTAIQELEKAGHCIGISSDRSGDNVAEAHDEYVRVVGTKPLWYHVGMGRGRHPSPLRHASHLGMKIAFWSTHACVQGDRGLTEEQLATIKMDVTDKTGGSMIYLTMQDGSSCCGLALALRQVVDSIFSVGTNKGYVFAPLSSVAKDDPPMDL